MKTTNLATQQRSDVRSIFISDIHLGCQHSRVADLLAFLDQHTPENLYLVGDFIDARALTMAWYWPPIYSRLMNRIADLATHGTRVCYTPGNHDDYLRFRDVSKRDVDVCDEFVHVTADGQRVVIIHGDQFDSVESHARWLSLLGSVSYATLLGFDRSVNRCLKRLRLRPRPISRFIKQSTKRIVKWLSGFEDRVLAHARQRDADVIMCGHVHIPGQKDFEGLTYYNLGDWVENATAVVESQTGQLSLLSLGGDPYQEPEADGASLRGSGRDVVLTAAAACITRDLFAGMHGPEVGNALPAMLPQLLDGTAAPRAVPTAPLSGSVAS